ncbi:MAG TPA: XkdX family protein [Clostridiales bacterium]|nr:XkdX family protein [Clostridiales bacterium]
MFNDLKRLFDEGKLTIDGLDKAVIKGWITADEKETIIGGEQDGI